MLAHYLNGPGRSPRLLCQSELLNAGLRGTGAEACHSTRKLWDRISVARMPRHIQRQSGLSKRELEIVRLICDGLTMRQVAVKLGITVKTVEFHRHNIMETWDVGNTALLVRKAIRLGIVKA